MQLTLTVTPSHALPESLLRDFIIKAEQRQQDPTATLASLIRDFVGADKPARKPKKKAAK